MILGLLYSIVRSVLDLLVLCRKTDVAALAPRAGPLEVGAVCPPPPARATGQSAERQELIVSLARENPR